MRPLDRPAVGAAWTSPAVLDFSRSRSAAVVQTVFGTDKPATTACLALLDDDVSAARVLQPDEVAAAAVVKDKVNDTYGAATPYLLDAVGSYCAYCEIPVQDPIQLEHVLPKAEYPTFALDWDNFLPSCIGCNSRKRDNPLRAETAAQLGVTTATPAQCEQHIRSVRYRWPDRDDVEGYFIVRLHYQAGGTWTCCPVASAVDRGTRWLSTSVVDGEVSATIPAEGLQNVPVAALVVDAAGDTRTSASIDLMKLARHPVPLDSGDRRTIHRTEVWLRAVEVLNDVCVGGLPAALPPNVVALVVSFGSWRTWLSVAQALDPALALLLIDATKHALPGTDPTRLP